MNNSDWVIPVTIILGTLALIYICIIVLIALLRRGLWLLSKPFFLIDESMWFLYNPLRFAMRNQEARSNRIGYYLFTILFGTVANFWVPAVWPMCQRCQMVGRGLLRPENGLMGRKNSNHLQRRGAVT